MEYLTIFSDQDKPIDSPKRRDDLIRLQNFAYVILKRDKEGKEIKHKHSFRYISLANWLGVIIPEEIKIILSKSKIKHKQSFFHRKKNKSSNYFNRRFQTGYYSKTTQGTGGWVSLEKTRYQKYLEGPIWEGVRERYYKDHKQECSACGSDKRINLHHKVYRGEGKEEICDLVPLCYKCHGELHRKIGETKSNMIEETDNFVSNKKQNIAQR